MHSENQNVLPYVSGHNYATKSVSENIKNDSNEIKKISVKEICVTQIPPAI